METVVSQNILMQEFPASRPSLRLAVVTETWPPEVNGVALTLSRLVQGQCERNHQVQLVRPRQTVSERGADNAGFEEVLMRGMPIPRYPQLKLGLPGKKALVAAWALQRPDLVHIATEGPLGWSALQAARQLRLPVTSDFRTNFHSYSQHYGLGWLKKPIVAYLRKFHNLTQCTMVPTRALCAELISSGFENTRVVARGVDTQMFRPDLRNAALRASWGADEDSLVALVVGRLAPEKNLDVAIQAFDAMRAKHPSVKLVFVGDGPAREALRQRCPQATFVGQRRQDELALFYASADLCLFPSLTETFGNVTLEALSSGLPVLAFDTAAASEWLVHHHSGWLAPVGDAQAYVACARELAAHPERIAMARAPARGRVVQLDWQQIAAQVEAVFMEVMARHAAHVPRVRPLPAF
ncbi:glycosyltransferase family 4 protein [Hydrogenophaga sp. A37]|uniref:glycosyltransferase family 4 protein n=1 Tax=Hydrogenophaga sp. A37 TaxID=1945864 RepID=UPI000984E0CA|nr:glycosyltransferase family 1 protein [Hydrogenophaga sp. A37]OOG82612.1 glycoside hydrolase [Hydrogenophaga sp. A37]